MEPISPLDGSMLGSMATVPVPPDCQRAFATAAAFQAHLYATNRIEVPVIDWGGRWHVRVSAQAYNTPQDYLSLAGAVCAVAGGAGGGGAGTVVEAAAAAARAC